MKSMKSMTMMKRMRVASMAILLCSLATMAAEAKPKTIQLKPSDDIAKAIATAKADPLANTEGATICLQFAEGTYRLAKPLEIHWPHKATLYLYGANAGVYGANTGATVFSGGVGVKNWKLAPDGTLVAKIAKGLRIRELWVNGQRATPARFPNAGYLRVENTGKDRRTNFTIAAGKIPADFGRLEGSELFFLHDWSVSHVPISQYDPKSRTLTTLGQVGCSAAHYAINHFEKHPRFFLQRHRALLDAPGEWHYEPKTGEMVYMPRKGETADTLQAEYGNLTQLLRIRDSKNVEARNIRFTYTGFAPANGPDGRFQLLGAQAAFYENVVPGKKKEPLFHWRKAPPAAIVVDRSEKIEFTHCQFLHLAGSGVWIREQCRNSEVGHSRFDDIGANGVMIGETTGRIIKDKGAWWQVAPEQATTGCESVECEISRCGQTNFGAVGIWVGLAAKTRIRENHLYDLPYTGISVGWMWWNPRTRPAPLPTPAKANEISRNFIHHVLLTLSDGGAIYCLGNQPGSTILKNWIHDIPAANGRAPSNGLFLDQGTGGFTISKNFFYRIDQSPIRFHKGWANTITKNVFALSPKVPTLHYSRDSRKDKITVKDNITIPLSAAEAKVVPLKDQKTLPTPLKKMIFGGK